MGVYYHAVSPWGWSNRPTIALWSVWERIILGGSSLPIMISICEGNLTLAVLELLLCCGVEIWAVVNRLIIEETVMGTLSLFNTWMLLGLMLTGERMLHSLSDSVKTETNSWLVSRCCTYRLLSRGLLLFLNSLEHCHVGWMSGVLQSSNDRFLDCKLLDWIRRVCCESKLCDLWWISWLWVRVRCRRFLRAQFIIALDHNGTKLESVLVWSLNVYH